MKELERAKTGKKINLYDPQDLWEIFSVPARQNWIFVEGVDRVTYRVKLTKYFRK